MSSAAGKAWPRSWPAALAWALWALTLLGLAATFWLDELLPQAGVPELALLTGGNVVLAVGR